MFELDQIKAVQQRAVAESWPYHYLFNSLKALGVERYEVNVLTHETKFVGMGASLVAPVPDGFRTLTVGAVYNEEALKKAYPGLKRHPGPVYIRYSLGTRTGTDFYVKSQRVQRIVVRTY